MTDELRIDSHKLMFHPREVSRWMRGETIFPIYVEISPSGACNHRCLFCALDYAGYTPRFLDTAILRERIAEMARLGVKSIMFGGEGEPLLHRDIGELILHTKAKGIDVAVTTNGVLLTRELAGRIVGETSWIKVSLDAGTASTYAAIHRTREEDFERTLANISAAAGEIARRNADCVLGVQAILLPENASEMETIARRAREAGAAYLVIKSYSQHRRSITRRYQDLGYESAAELAERMRCCSDGGFRVIVRSSAMRKLQRPDRGYDHCLALPFWTYIDAGGTVWGCSAFLGDERFSYGSIREDTFERIWLGERRRTLETAARDLDPAECRRNCRMDEVNRYLWELTHPPRHVNFI